MRRLYADSKEHGYLLAQDGRSGGQCVLPDLPVSVPMGPNRLAELIPALERTTAEISRMLESVAGDQDWRPNDGHWSFRHIAAHLEACQTECVLVRVRQIAAVSPDWSAARSCVRS